MVKWTFAQENTNTQFLLIHEDQVVVSKTPEYLKASKGLIKLLDDHNFTGVAISAFRMDDNTFMYSSPIENMADLDTNPYSELRKQAGKEKSDAVMNAFDGTYDTHRDFIAAFHPDLSYKPEQLQEGEYNYREWMYFYYNQTHQEKVMDIIKEWKELYEDNNIETGYMVFTNGLGHEGPVLIVHSWAENPTDLSNGMEKRNELIGDEARALWERTQSLGYKMYT